MVRRTLIAVRCRSKAAQGQPSLAPEMPGWHHSRVSSASPAADPAAPPLDPSVVLVGYPVRLGRRQQEHNDELLRELSLLVITRATPGAQLHAPIRLLDMMDMLVRLYSSELETVSRQREEALARGELTIDLRYPAVAGTRKIISDYEAVAREVDDFCAEGALLTLATPPDLLRLRHWTLAEFYRQFDGEAPQPWPGPLH